MAIVTYNGEAMDHEVTPQRYRIGTNGKPDRRLRPAAPAKISRKKMPQYKLWGTVFAAGEPVEVDNKMLAAKAKALGCFDVLDDKAACAAEQQKQSKAQKARS